MTIEERIESLSYLQNILGDQEKDDLQNVIIQAYSENQWFTPEYVKAALIAINQYYLNRDALIKLANDYHLDDKVVSKKIGLVLAGNIPLVGFHDILCTYLVGHIALVKLSDKDRILIPYLIKKLIEKYPRANRYFQWVEKLSDYDAAIATGSNTTARHFEYYFRHVPHVIRQNRNSVAVIKGNESEAELQALGSDIFSYFGLGCRNVSKLYVPKGYDITSLFVVFEKYKEIIHHNKYKNNFDYNVALYLLNKETFLHNDFVMFKEAEPIVSRIGCLHYEYYENEAEIIKKLKMQLSEIQCVVCNEDLNSIPTISAGQAQCPSLDTFADDVDTIQFLLTV
jgi:hypothetical protein